MERVLDIGKFRKRITIVKPAERINSLSQTVQEWADVKTIWADVRPEKGTEPTEANKVDNQRNYKIYTRFFSFIDEKCLVRYKGRLLEIASISDMNEQGRFLELVCRERVADHG